MGEQYPDTRRRKTGRVMSERFKPKLGISMNVGIEKKVFGSESVSCGLYWFGDDELITCTGALSRVAPASHWFSRGSVIAECAF